MDDASRRGGFTIREYERHVWDMAKHQLHPTLVFVAAQVFGATRLLEHALYQAPGGLACELALFLASFVGAWACFYSTMLRVAGLPSRAVTLLAPTAIVAALAIWFVFPSPAEMSPFEIRAASALLVGPGVLAWPLTMRRWRVARSEAASIIAPAPRP
jgi:hypothetical protein